ncbi:hypothetical protein PIB30_105367, partial [Stylosanthes scabra]|nr:hypothetical protein [Stylosanthes scabra]
MSVPELLSSVTAATATATALFLICKSRLMRLRPHEKNLSNLVILELVDARNYEPEALPKENLVVLVASTSEVWNQPSTRDPFSPDNMPSGARYFVNWIVDYKHTFRVGAFVMNACSFSAFVVGRGVTENGKNLMAKAANQIRDLGHTAELNVDFESWWGSVVAVLQGAILGVEPELEPEPE